jgi:hypothetical protein
MRVLLVAYALSPSRGSEAAVGWEWASGLAMVHDVTVLSRAIDREDVRVIKCQPDLLIEHRPPVFPDLR